MPISMTQMTCACGCGKTKMVRTADINRGWGKHYSKRCKARHQASCFRVKKPTSNESDFHNAQHIKGLPDQKSNARVPYGPCKGKLMHQVKTHILKRIIQRCKNPYINNAAYDEYAYREKLWIL